MPTKVKIKLNDSIELRAKLDEIYEAATQEQIVKWALSMSVHILEIAAPGYLEHKILTNGFLINKLQKEEKSRVHQVRQESLKIHQLAKACEDEKIKIVLRVAGHAAATGHMKEHGMVASDYAIKYVNLEFPNNIEAVISERSWQIQELKKCCE